MSSLNRPIEHAVDANQNILHTGDLVAYAIEGPISSDRPQLALAKIVELGIGDDERGQTMPVAVVEILDGQSDSFSGVPTGVHNLMLVEVGDHESGQTGCPCA